MGNTESLIKCLEPEKLRSKEPMSAHTTLRVGGEADLFYETKTSGDLVKAVRLGRSFGVPVTVIGEGSGVVVGDKGIRGIVVKSSSERIQIRPHRSFTDIFRRGGIKKMEVTIDGGVKVLEAIKKLEKEGVVGFEAFEFYAGSVAGMAREGIGRELLKNMSVIDTHGGIKSISPGKEIGENIVIDATYLLSMGKPKRIKEKMLQKKGKLGRVEKVFRDLPKEETEILGYPTGDPGYLIGEILNMKGFQMGKIAISEKNQNTIVNLGGGTAREYVRLVDEVKERAREAVGIELEEKVRRLGEF